MNSDHKYVFQISVYNLDKLEFDFIDENKEKLIPVSTDEDSKINLSLYSLTKYNQEQVLELLCPNLGIQPIILRYQNVYGQVSLCQIHTLEYYLYFQLEF